MAGSLLSRLLVSRTGVAAAEMALVVPLLMVLLFAAFETGYYFYSAHVVATAVRDGARYASRLPFTDFPCGGAITPTSAETNIQNITFSGDIAGSGQRLAGWTSAASTVVVTFACDTTNASVNNGIFKGLSGGVRVVTVTATVPYVPLVAQFGYANTSTPKLHAQSQATVMGI